MLVFPKSPSHMFVRPWTRVVCGCPDCFEFDTAADACMLALQHDGKTYGLVCESLTGEQMVAIIADLLGKKVTYTPVSPATFASWGFPGAQELADMFEFTNNHPDKAPRSVEDTKALVPRLHSFRDWAAGVIAATRAAGSAPPASHCKV